MVNMADTFPILYILMRTDLPSMNPGKAMAQASHASNAFIHELPEWNSHSVSHGATQLELVAHWKDSTPQGFGTVLVLGVTETQMRTADRAARLLGFLRGIVTDPTYPAHLEAEAVDIINKLTASDVLGKALETADKLLAAPAESPWTAPCIPAGNKTVTFRKEDTCSYIFGDKNDTMLEAIVGRFPLHP